MSARDLRYELTEAFIGAGHTEGFSRETADGLLAQHRAEVLREAADALEAQSCDCGCRRGAPLLRTLADGSAT